MDIESIRAYCLQKKACTEDTPFGPNNLTFKVLGKMFAILSLDEIPSRIALKCDPDRVHDLRSRYPEITTGPYLNKKHWNSVLFEDLETSFVRELVDHSYQMVIKKMTKKAQAELANLPD